MSPNIGVKLVPKKYVVHLVCALVMLTLSISRQNFLLDIMLLQESDEEVLKKFAMCPNMVTVEGVEHGMHQYLGDFTWAKVYRKACTVAVKVSWYMTMLLMGHKCDLKGGKKYLRIALIVAAVILFLVPIFTRRYEFLFVLFRLLLGISQGLAYPAVHNIIAHWSTGFYTTYRTAVTSVVLLSTSDGIITRYLVTNAVFFVNKWSHLYYVISFILLLTFLIMEYTCYNDPKSHPLISDSEKLSIWMKSNCFPAKSIPWLDIFSSWPIYLYLVVNIWFSWIDKHLKMIRQHILRSRSPIGRDVLYRNWSEVIMLISGIVCAIISDILIMLKVSVSTVRKIFVGMGIIGSSACIIYLLYMAIDDTRCYEDLMSISWLLTNVMKGGLLCSTNILHFDLTPTFAATVLSICHPLYSFLNFIPSNVIEAILPPESATLSEHKRIFWGEILVALITYCIFIFFGTAELQSWNNPGANASSEEEEGHNKSAQKNYLLDDIYY